MGGVLSYSGLSTKIRAMQSRLTTMDQFEEILQLSDVTQVAAYLKRMPEYSSRWDALDENTLHRGQIEKLLKKSIFRISPEFITLPTRSSVNFWICIPSDMKSVY